MSNLRPGHHGYAYQDILTGNAFVELLLDLAVSVKVDLKDFDGDLFDDITIAYADGRRLRLQIKHTTIDRELSQATFTANGRHLRLDLILRSLLNDLTPNPDTTYRVVVRDGQPDANLAKVLTAIHPSADPGGPLPGITTQRHKFAPDKLTQLAPWKTLLSGFTEVEIRRACDRLIIDTAAPAANLSFRDPGPADAALLQRAIELGAGRPPNNNRTPEEVALTLVHAATRARSGDAVVTRADIAAEVRLTTDFGAVREGHPVEPGLAVTRQAATSIVKTHIDTAMPPGGLVVLVGEPGAGKSWLSQQVADAYKATDWIVARHHCWLGETDSDRTQRVLVEVVIGSLLNQLELQAPDAVAGVRPRFAATAETLATALRGCRTQHSDKNILLIVDGLDHIDRVRGRIIGGATADPARAVVDQLANIDLPEGVCLLLASQPGPHLDQADPTCGYPLQMPRMSVDELTTLAERHEVLKEPEGGAPIADSDRRAIVDLLDARSNGNALYATYLCRHATGASPHGQTNGTPATVAEIIERLRQVPENATDLDAYYQHLLNSLTDGELQAVGALAICDFALTKDELGELLPAFEPLLVKALKTLAPVLVSLPGAGGLKVHHESLSRHIRRDKSEAWSNHIRQSAADWLQRRGFFTDTRAFRNLPQLLAELGRYDDLTSLVDRHFVSNAIAHLQPPEAIKHVLSTVATEAQNRRDWRALIACVEALRAVGVYENESLPDTLVEYADIVVSILGAEVVAERLMYEGRTTFPARWGLNLCEAVDRAGVPAPWEPYLAARTREDEADSTHYGEESDARLRLSEQLGYLRLRYDAGRTLEPAKLSDHFDNHPGHPPLDQLVEIFASAIPADDLLEAAQAMANPANAATVFITLADLADSGTPELSPAIDLAREAAKRAPAAYISDYLDHGIPAADLTSALGYSDLPAELRTASQTLLADNMGERPEHVRTWLDLLRLAHATDPNIPITINGDISGEGFYRAWLRFAVDTVGLDEDVIDGTTTPDAASTTVKVALQQLAANASPFTGNPRACDLWSIHHLIHEVIERALRVVLPADLDEVLAHLTTIGENTTTSLMGMAEGGPLATNDLLAILSRVADRIGVEPIHKLMPVIRDNRYDGSTMYSVTADFETAMARIYLDAGDRTEAEACWERAAALLCTYGGHKDHTIYEFIEAAKDLADLDTDQARTSLARIQNAAYLAADHSDGRGTNHAPRAWWEQAADLDPIGAATAAATTLIREYGFEDYLAHTTHTQTLATHIDTAAPIALAALRYTVGPDWRQPATDLHLLTRLKGEYGTTTAQSGTALAIFANHVAASYDNQALMHTRDLPTGTAPPDLVNAIRALGGPAFTPPEPREEDNSSGAYPTRSDRDPEPLYRTVEASLRPVFGPGPKGAALAVRDYQDAGYRPNHNTIRYNLDTLASTIGWRILEATSADGAPGGKDVLDAVARELRYMTADELFAILAEALANRCNGTIPGLEQVASYAYTLAYTRIRGGGGWQTFAGRNRADLWTKARDLHPDTADDALASAIAYNVATERYGLFGITQAVIAAFAAAPAQGTAGTALEVWNAAFDILEERLPGDPSRTGSRYTPTPTPDDPNQVDTALATLAIAAICQPKVDDIRSALLALTLLIACRPQLAQSSVIPLLEADLDAGRHTWILETIRDHLPFGGLANPLKETLTTLATSDRLSVRAMAGEVLEHHGHPVPSPPATTPDGAIRLAIAQALDER